MSSFTRLAAAIMALAAACPLAAHAELGVTPPDAPAAPSAPVPSPGQPGWASNLFAPSQTTLLGDMWGLRPALDRAGLSLGLQVVGELSANPTGGYRRGATYKGLALLSMGLDTAKAGWWEGGIFNVSALQIHGRDITVDNIGVLNVLSSTEASRSTRLWEAWFQQSFLGGKIDVKVGQQAVDLEFMTSNYAAMFVNASFGYPLVPSLGQYGGGPAYPLAALGVRLRAQPTPDWTMLLGVFDDNAPGGPFYDDSQIRGASQSGTKFHTGTGALIMTEVQYGLNTPGKGPDGKPVNRGLPGTYKLGAWYDTGRFPDQRYDTAGLSLADPASSGIARQRRNNWGLYAGADQMIWRPHPDSPQVVGAFIRAFGAPGDRNLSSFSANAGITLKAPFHGRDDDIVGIGYGYGRIGARAIALDRDRAAVAGAYPIRSSESYVELTYLAQVAPWWTVQPNFQYFWLPGGGVPDPLNPARRIANPSVYTLKTTLTF